MCWLCTQKLACVHVDANLQGQQTTISNTLQTGVTTFATPTYRHCDANRSEKETQLIIEMTTRDLLPVCFVEDTGFRKFMRYTEPEHTAPVTSWLELSLMFSNMYNLNNKTKQSAAHYNSI